MAIASVGNIGDGGGLTLSKPAAKVGCESRRKGNRCDDFVFDEVFYIIITRCRNRVAILTVFLLWKNDDTVKSSKVVVYELHGSVD